MPGQERSNQDVDTNTWKCNYSQAAYIGCPRNEDLAENP